MSRCKVLHAAWLKLYLNRIDTSHCTTRTTKARYLRALAAADDLKVLIHSRATEAEAEAGDARFRILQYSFLFQHCTMIRQVYSNLLDPLRGLESNSMGRFVGTTFPVCDVSFWQRSILWYCL